VRDLTSKRGASLLALGTPSWRNASTLPRRSRTAVAAAGGGGGSKRKNPFSTVEAAVNFLAQLLSAGDMFGTTSGGKGFEDGLGLKPEDPAAAAKVELRGWKWIKIRASARTKTRVSTERGEPLDAYLRLPPEEYALLDPRFVTRTSPETFTFAVPLRSTMRAETYSGPAAILRELTPSIDFTTGVDVARQVVTLSGTGASLGQEDLDRRFELNLQNALSWEAVFDGGGEADSTDRDDVRVGVVVMEEEDNEHGVEGGGGRERGRAGAGSGPPDASSIIAADFVDASDANRNVVDAVERRAAVPPKWDLSCEVELRMRVQVPRPLSLAPSFMLGGAFSVIAGAVTQAMLPRFAEFLAADYARWARGEDRNAPVGSFAEEDETRGDAVKVEEGAGAEADAR
jgi:hypothetical protein